MRRLLEQHPDRREEVALLGWTVGEQAPETGFAVVELAADAAVAGQDWASAAAALQEFVTRVPNHIPALMRLVEICVDGGLEATMYSAQAHLADAYLAGGLAAEARFIAEDLVAREPWDRSNLERFRRALELLGEPDPEALIAERLSGQSPFMTTDLFLESHEFPGGAPGAAQAAASPVPPDAAPDAAPPAPIAAAIETEPEAPVAAKPPKKGPAKPASKLGTGCISSSARTRSTSRASSASSNRPLPSRTRQRESVEVDLSIVLDDIKRPSNRPEPPAAAPPSAPTPGDIDGVFAHLRDDARLGDGRSRAAVQARAGAARGRATSTAASWRCRPHPRRRGCGSRRRLFSPGFSAIAG